LRNAGLGRLPRAINDHSSLEKATDQLQNSSVADFLGDQINQSFLVNFVKGSGDRLPISAIIRIM
jgi:hypothetical protein